MRARAPYSGRAAFLKHDMKCIRSVVVLAFKKAWEQLRSPAIWPATMLWFLDWLWRIVRPTLITALCVNSRISEIPPFKADQHEADYRRKLDNCTPEDLSFAVNTLFSLHESDHNRIRGIESKAFGTLRVASLVFAGNAFTLNLALSQKNPPRNMGDSARCGIRLVFMLLFGG